MGCSASKLDDEEAVQLCRDRKNFVKEANEQRNRFASLHTAYIQSLRRVSLALCNYVDGDEHHGFFLNSYTTSPSTHVKRVSPEVISIPLKSFTLTPTKPGKSTSFVVNYFRSGDNPSVSIVEMPESPETVRIESYYPMDDHYGFDNYSLTTDAPPRNTSFFSSPHNRPSDPPASPQTSKWDLFWNPFLLMDTYGYPPMNGLDQVMDDDEITGLRMVREEGFPELEEAEDKKNKKHEESMKVEMVKKPKVVPEHAGEVAGEDTDEDDGKTRKVNGVKELQSQGMESKEVSESRNAVELKVNNEQRAVSNGESIQETPCFTVYINRRPTSMAEVMKDVERQFLRICDFANEVSVMLETGRAQKSSNSIAGMFIKLLAT